MVSYPDTLAEIQQHLTDEEIQGMTALKKQLLNGYLNLGQEISVKNRQQLRFVETSRKEQRASCQEIIETLEDKNCTVMFGAGKDSSFVLTIARALQLELLAEYGVTFELRVGIGRHPGMIDCLQTLDDEGNLVDGNIEKVLQALNLHHDPLVDIFFIDNQHTIPYTNNLNDEGFDLSNDVIEQNRHDVLVNGHLWGGAGRRTFCDDCNKNLSRWIAVALAYKDGADLYMTGDSRKELNTQIGTDVPNMLKALGIADEPSPLPLTPTQNAFYKLDMAGTAHTRLTQGDTDEQIVARHIPYERIPDHTRLVTVFDQITYDSNKRMPFFHDFLEFDFDSLMFSFTETDCGNPALMCHNIGLIAEAIGSSYVNGIRAYVEYGIGKMEEKGFADELVAKMRKRYEDDKAILHMREKVEDYAWRAYHLKPEHLEAMVYAPFTEKGKNLALWLEAIDNPQLSAHANDIRTMLSQDKGDQSPLTDDIIATLSDKTGLELEQMQHLARSPLMINHFKGQATDVTRTGQDEREQDGNDYEELTKRRLGLGIIGTNDSLYYGTVWLPDGHQLNIMGR